MSWEPVYAVTKKIPRGRVTTYGALARALGTRGGARAVGHAMAACPSGRGIPWHRVVGSGGHLLIREPYAGLQRRLLEAEGIAIEQGHLDIKQYGWAPTKQQAKRTAVRPKSRKRRRVANK